MKPTVRILVLILVLGFACLPVWSAAATFSATARKARASGSSGASIITGVPASDVSRMRGTKGISPRNGAPTFSAVSRAPPCPKM